MRIIILSLSVFLMFQPLAGQTTSAEELNKSGIEYSEEKKYDKAGQAYAESVMLYDKQSAQAWYKKGIILMNRGNNDEALSCFLEAAHRDPGQPGPVERAGYLYYRKGAYEDAVKNGEKVLALDPENAAVKTWLPDAYRQRVRMMRNPTTAAAPEKPAEPGPKPLFDPCGLYNSKLILEASAMIRTGMDNDGENKYRYISSPGQITNFPYTLTASYKINERWGVLGAFQNPYTGGGMAEVCGQEERIEGLFYTGRFIIGAGVSVFHYRGDDVFGTDSDIFDIKGGISLLHKGTDTELELLFYPKYLIPDGSWSKGKTMDVSRFNMKYTYIHRRDLRIFSKIRSDDYYFYDNSAGSAVYYGSLIFAAGLHYDLFRFLNRGDLRFTGEIGKRINLTKEKESGIYGLANGMGYLGFDLSGDGIFSGYHSSSTLYTVGISERFSRNFYFSQDLTAEIGGYKFPRNEYTLRLTGGYAL